MGRVEKAVASYNGITLGIYRKPNTSHVITISPGFLPLKIAERVQLEKKKCVFEGTSVNEVGYVAQDIQVSGSIRFSSHSVCYLSAAPCLLPNKVTVRIEFHYDGCSINAKGGEGRVASSNIDAVGG